jgi:hypothetical protein
MQFGSPGRILLRFVLKCTGHKHPEIFHNQNEKLEKQLKLFNSLVQDINLSCCPKAKNTVQFIYMSPNFTKDILHKKIRISASYDPAKFDSI